MGAKWKMFGVRTANLPNYWTITWMTFDVGIRNFGDQIEKTPFLLVFCSGKTPTIETLIFTMTSGLPQNKKSQ